MSNPKVPLHLNRLSAQHMKQCRVAGRQHYLYTVCLSPFDEGGFTEPLMGGQPEFLIKNLFACSTQFTAFHFDVSSVGRSRLKGIGANRNSEGGFAAMSNGFDAPRPN